MTGKQKVFKHKKSGYEWAKKYLKNIDFERKKQTKPNLQEH